MATLDISGLTREERLALLEELWESLSADRESLPLSAAHKAELDRRVAELDRNGPSGIPWEQAREQILKRK